MTDNNKKEEAYFNYLIINYFKALQEAQKTNYELGYRKSYFTININNTDKGYNLEIVVLDSKANKIIYNKKINISNDNNLNIRLLNKLISFISLNNQEQIKLIDKAQNIDLKYIIFDNNMCIGIDGDKENNNFDESLEYAKKLMNKNKLTKKLK